MFDKWRRRAEQRTLPTRPTWPENPSPGTMLPESALAIADVFACVTLLSDSAAAQPRAA